MKKIYLSILFSLLIIFTEAQFTFQKTYGTISIGGDVGNSVLQMTDGGYVVAGAISDDSIPYYSNVYLIRTNQYGDTLWTKIYGGLRHDFARCIRQTKDGGFIITGGTNSFSTEHYDIYLIKTDEFGDTLWTRCYGQNLTDVANDVQQTTDGGFIITGYTTDGGYRDHIYLVRTDSNGNLLWTKIYSSPNNSYASAVLQTPDSGFILIGSIFHYYYGWVVCLMRTNSSGDTLWTKEPFDGQGLSIQKTFDGGYIMTGYTGDAFLSKTDSSANILWTKSYGRSGSYEDFGTTAQQTTDNGYIVAGWTYGPGSYDIYLVKTNSQGDTLWTKTYSGSNAEIAKAIYQTYDGGFIITGYTSSFGLGDDDLFLIKTDVNGNSGCFEGETNTTVHTLIASNNSAQMVIYNGGIISLPNTNAAAGSIVKSICTTTTAQSEIPNHNSEFSLFPNPTTSTFTLNCPLSTVNCQLNIYNTYGQIIHHQIINQQSEIINLSTQPKGVYFLQVENVIKKITLIN
jgi:hypothetical protein